MNESEPFGDLSRQIISPQEIRNLADIYKFLVQSDDFDLLEAASIHWFRIELKKKLKIYQEKKGSDLTDEEISKFIFTTYGVDELNSYNKKALNSISLFAHDISNVKILDHIEKRENLVLDKTSEILDELKKPEQFRWSAQKSKVLEHFISLILTAFIFFCFFKMWPYIEEMWFYAEPFIIGFFKYLYGIALHEFSIGE